MVWSVLTGVVLACCTVLGGLPSASTAAGTLLGGRSALLSFAAKLAPTPSRTPAHARGTSMLAAANAGPKGGGASLDAQLANLERRATAAAASWDTVATAFLDAPLADAACARLGALADCAAVRVGGFPGARRAMFVLTHPELVTSVVASEHVTLFRVSADFASSDPLANCIVNIGVGLESVGDVLLEGDDTAYIVVAASSAKTFKRLLPKGLKGGKGGAVTIDEHDGAVEGVLQELEVQRLDKRAQR
mmetsp:Transcript_23475/g.58589  ORF Transcript_23475/g.58589 Transcript_23475/m.58589 type:complete len:248 (-) Transcript_23475:87-830(-)